MEYIQQKDIKSTNPMSTINWARKYKIQYDVFVFLGITKMNLRNIKYIKKKYEEFLKKRVKYAFFNINKSILI